TEIGNDVVEGNVAINLIKPISYRMSLVFKAFGLMIYRLVIPSLFIWIILEIYKVAKLGMDVSNLFTIISFMLSLVLSFLIYIFFDYCFGMLAFVTTYIFGMNIIKNALLNFLTGKLIPISFFPLFIQKVFAFLPFVSMTYVPVLIYMGKYSKIEVLVQLGKQILWVIILYWFGYFLWNKVQRKMVILGG
ncbi:MAG: ABC-2 family transporter protein, partial [Anaeroplasmataceae bacterium]|nr:ABC-2 family transporter protein [Anaeroplasmataceae bacterium]